VAESGVVFEIFDLWK